MTKARDLANASTALSAVSATELAFVDGVTSAIQTQMDAKAPSSTAVTLTGTQTLTNKTLTSPVISSVINNTLTSTTGDIIYASAANTPARLGIGSSAQVLTVASGVPSWATPASSGSMTSLASGSLPTGAATLTLSSISASYNNLILVVNSFRTATNGDYLRMRFNSITTGSYTSQLNYNAGTNYTTDTSMRIGGSVNSTTNVGQLNVFILNYAVANYKFFNSMGLDNGSTTTESSMSLLTGGTQATTAISSITIFSNSTNNFAAGTYILYGVN